MALINCPKCGNPVSDKAIKCPHCGIDVQNILAEVSEEQRLQQTKRKRRIIISIASVFVIGMISVLAYLYSIDALNTIPADYRKETEKYFERYEIAVGKGDFEKGTGVLGAIETRTLTNRQAKRYEEMKITITELRLKSFEDRLVTIQSEEKAPINSEFFEQTNNEMAVLAATQLDALQFERFEKAKKKYVEIQITELERKTDEYKTNPSKRNYLYKSIKDIAEGLQKMELSGEQQEKVDSLVYEIEAMEVDRKNNPLNYLVVTPKSVDFIHLGDYAGGIPSKGDFYDKIKKEKDEYTEWWVDVHYDVYFKGEKILELSVDDNDKITSISICTPKIKLENGIHIGMTPMELESHYKAKFIVTEGEGLWLKYVVPGYESCQLVGRCPDGWVLSNGKTLDYDDIGSNLPANLLRGCKLEHIHLVSW